ncbi:VWA domain-containing protein [Arenibaculum pallidiluteum]|uniref:VWA domain-containing protein n=1 Tax=Arenibaculum pallidiluteum TaxID=2812559 RepID=UPI001A9605A6|nr:vWA domain-containing protein [Arenibaculum pallidiluteum]
MRSRIRNSFEFMSVSALDLFASALGVFVLLTFVLLPHYLKQPSLEAEVAGAAKDAARTAEQLALYKERLIAARAAREDAEGALLAAQRQLAAARQDAARRAAVGAPPAAIPTRARTGLSIPDLDLVIVLDTTGSMRDELEDLQAGLLGIVRVLHRMAASLSIGVVAYRDDGEAYVTRALPLGRIDGRTLSGVLDFVERLRAEAGGDPPEAVYRALAQATAMAWRNGVQRQILVIGDAPAHPAQAQRTLDLASGFRNAGGSVRAIYTGADGAGRTFFERLAEAGGGEFRQHRGAIAESILLSVLDAPPKE